MVEYHNAQTRLNSAFFRIIGVIMPLGIVSDELFDSEINKRDDTESEMNIAEVLDLPNLGRPEGKKNTPDFIRNIIGEEIINGADKKELAQLFNVGPQVPELYSKGARSQATYHDRDNSTARHVNSVREKIVKKASNRLTVALNEITPDKLREASLKDLSTVAKNMSGIIKDMSPEEKPNDNPGNQIIIFAPQRNELNHYEVMQLQE